VSFLEIFQPGLKHLREERDRQKMLVVRPSHAGGAPMGIDLDAGKATIAVTPSHLEPEDPEANDTGPA
jgi:Family of unknown function (DUF6191)